ncbi:MAG: fatty acid desaturase [Oligoflexia bacterium]|nr:fatty acid desaturase [Oligoflexia bacterium]
MQEQIRQLSANLDFKPEANKVLSHLLFNAVVFSLAVLLIKQGSTICYFLAQAFWPILFFRNFTLMHDAVHGAVSKSKSFNNSMGYIAGALCFLPYWPWKQVHLQHHYWAGNIDQDPTMKIIKNFNPEAHTLVAVLQFFWRSWIPLLAFMQHIVFWSAGFKSIVKSSKKDFSCNMYSYGMPLIIYFAIYKGLGLGFLDIAPGLAIYLVMVEVINFPHHLQLPQNRGNKLLPIWRQYEVTRSCSYPKWFSYLIINNFNYHVEHHLFPILPWYRLHLVRPLLKNIVGRSYNESIRGEWILQSRKQSMSKVLIYSPEQILNAEDKVASSF